MSMKSDNPYVGPRTFQENERDRFFGRDREARDLLALVVSEQMVLFYAQSGAGKSSLVNTCLIPDLRAKGFDVYTGRVAGEAPPETPVENIYVFNLLRSLETDEIAPESLAKTTISDYFTQIDHKTSAETRPEENSSKPYYLIIDQFEELFSTHHEAWEKREDFFQQLAKAMQDDPYLWVVLVMREDYIAALDPYARLVPGRFRRRYYMQRLEREAALEAIRKPVAKIRPFEEGIAERLVDDLSRIKIQMADESTATHPGQFVEGVQLQVVCYKLWKDLDAGDRITNDDLDKLGDVNTALEEHYADRVREVAEGKAISERAIRNWFSKKLITSAGTRNLVLRETKTGEGQLDDDVIQALQSDLVRMEQRGASAFYELTHDRLVEPILDNNRKWFEENLENLSPLQRQANLWADEDRNEQWLLGGQALTDVEMWAKDHAAELSATEREFLEACRNKRNERRMARENRIARQRNWSVGIAVIIVVVLATLSTFANRQRNEAVANEKTAMAAQADAEMERSLAEQEKIRADSQKFSANALQQLKTKPDLAILLGIRAFNLDDNIESRNALFTTYVQTTSLRKFIYLDPDINTTVSPNGQTIATFNNKGVILLDLDGNQIGGPYHGIPTSVYAMAFSPDGKILATSGKDGSIILWDVETREPLGDALLEHTDWVNSLSFSSDGNLLVSVSDDDSIILWDISNPRNPTIFGGAPLKVGYNVNCMAIHPKGNIIASCDSSGIIYLMDITNPENPIDIGQIWTEQENIWGDGLAFNPNGDILVSGGFDGTVALWDLSNPEEPSLLYKMFPSGEYSDRVYTVAIDPTGKVVAGGYTGGQVVLWDISDPEEPLHFHELELVHTSSVNWLDFSRDGKTLASGGLDSQVVLWDIETGQTIKELKLGFNPINGVAFNPKDDMLTAGSDTGAIFLWDVSEREEPHLIEEMQGYSSSPSRISFDTSGNFLSIYYLVPTGFSTRDYRVVIDLAKDEDPVLGLGRIVYEDPEGDFLLYEGTDEEINSPFIMAYNVATGEATGTPIYGTFIAFDPFHEIVVYQTLDVENNPFINLWDINAGKQVGIPLEGEFVELSRNGSIMICLVTEADKKMIQLMDVKTGEQLGSAIEGDYIDIVADNKILLYKSLSEEDDQTIVLWDIMNGEMVVNPIAGIFSAVSQNGEILVYQTVDANGNNAINLVETETASALVDPVVGSYVSLSPNGKSLLLGEFIEGEEFNDEDNSFDYRLLDITTGELRDFPFDSDSNDSLNFSPDGNVLSYQKYDSLSNSNDVFLFRTIDLQPISNPVGGGFIVDTVLEGDTLVYQFNSPAGQQFTVINIDGQPNLIANAVDGEFRTFLQTDGDLVYSDGSALKNLDVNTGYSTFLSPDLQGELLSINPEGDTLIVRKGDVVEVRDAAQTSTLGVRITEPESLGEIKLATSSPTGDTLALFTTEGIILQDTFRQKFIGKPFNDHREIVTFPGYYSVFSPDGQMLAIGDYSANKVQLWDVETQGRIGEELSGYYPDFSPDGQILAVRDDDANTIRLWEVETQERIGDELSGNYSVFSPDDQILAIGDYSTNKVRLWEVETQERIGDELAGSYPVFSPDGQILAIRDYSANTVRLWDIETHERIGDEFPGGHPVFSPDGQILAIGDYDANTVQLWDVETQEPIGDELSGYSHVFSPDGQILAIYDYDTNTVRLWDTETQERIEGEFSGNNPVFSPDGQILVLRDYATNTVQLWDVETQERIGDDLSDGRPVFNPDGQILAIGNNFANTVQLWNVDPKNGTFSPLIGKFMGEVNALVYSPDGNKLASVGADGIILTDVGTQENIFGPIQGQSVVFSPDGEMIAVTNDNETNLLNASTGEPIGEPYAGVDPVFSPDGDIVALSNDEEAKITLWKPSTHQKLYEVPFNGNEILFSPDGDTIAILNWVYRGEDQESGIEGNPTATPEPQRKLGIVLRKIGSETSPEFLDTIPVSCEEEGCPLLATFSPDGKTLAYSDGTNVSFWDIEKQETFGNSIVVSNRLNDMSFILDGQFLTLYDSNDSTEIWEFFSRSPFGEPFEGFMNTTRLNPSVDQFLIKFGGNWYLWKFDPSDWVAQLCIKVGRNFSEAEWEQYFPDEDYRATCPQ